MNQCESLCHCAFFNHKLARMPMLSDALKQRYCLGEWEDCARYRVISHDAAVPDDLYPDDLERANHIVDNEPEPWRPALLTGGSAGTGGGSGAAGRNGSAAMQGRRGEMTSDVNESSAFGDAPRRLKIGAGSSELADSRAAGRQAAEAAREQLGTVEPALVLVYASVRYDLGELLHGVREITGDTPLVGASSSGHFHEGALTEPGCGAEVLLLGEGPYRFGVGHAGNLRAEPFAAGRAVAEAARAAIGDKPRHSALLTLPCGVNVDHQALINGIYRVAGAEVPVVGGAASDDRKMQQTYVFRDGEVLTDAVVAVWIGSQRPIPVVFGHGWQSRGLPLPITSVDGPLVHTIAGQPALEVFQQQLHEAHAGNDLRADQPDQAPAEGIVRLAEAGRCIGIIEPDGSRTLRGVFADEGGSVRTWLPLPPYAAVQIMTCTQDELLDVCDEVVERALADGQPSVLLVFSCVARLRMLRQRGEEEAQRLQKAAGTVPVFGFYSYGELARTTSSNGVHNATITAIAL